LGGIKFFLGHHQGFEFFRVHLVLLEFDLYSQTRPEDSNPVTEEK
jgi:hypothetical protein